MSLYQNCSQPTGNITQMRLLCCGSCQIYWSRWTTSRLPSLLYWTWVQPLTVSIMTSYCQGCNVKIRVTLSWITFQFWLGSYDPDLDPVIPDWQISVRLVQWKPLDRNYALVWRSSRICFRTPSVLAAAQIFDIIASFRLSGHTPMLMIPSCTSACRHPNRRRLQPSWLHVSKVSINGWDPADWN